MLDILADKIPNGNQTDYLFAIDGKLPTQSKFSREWEKLQQRLNITATPHQLRHAFATMLYEAGIKEKDAQMLMGHSDIHLTQNIYTHISAKQQQETAKKLNKFTKTQKKKKAKEKP